MEPGRRHSHVRGSLAAVAVAMIVLRAGTAAAASEAGAQPLQLDISIGGDKVGLVGLFLLLADGRIAAHRSDLAEARIKVPGSGPPDELIVLSELLGDRFKYDAPTQSIAFDLDNSQRIARTFDAMGAAAPRAPVSTAWGSVLNYTFFGSETSGLDPRQAAFSGASANLDARVFSPYGTLSQTGILGTTTTRDMTALRLETTFSYSNPDSLVTYRAGDAITGGLNWTRPVRFGGIQVQRNFTLRSDLVTAPLPSFSGSAAVPSTLDIYLNNSKAYTQEVPTGPFQVNNLPLISGGDARLVLHDATGREVETTLPFYTSPQLLREGMSYFSMETGFPRLGYGIDSDDYVGREMASLSARYGLYDGLTLEGHAEGVVGLYNAGAGLLVRTGNFGMLSVAASGSTYQGQDGLQTYVAFETKFWGVSFNASSTRTYMSYNDIASVTAPVTDALTAVTLPAAVSAAPAKAIDRASVGWTLPDLSNLSWSYIHLQPASGATSNLVSVSWSRAFYAQSQLFVTAFTDLSDRSNYGIYAGISIPLGANSSASIGATRQRHQPDHRCQPPAGLGGRQLRLARARQRGRGAGPLGLRLLSRAAGRHPGRCRADAGQCGARHGPDRWRDRRHRRRHLLLQSHRRCIRGGRYRHARHSGVSRESRGRRDQQPGAAPGPQPARLRQQQDLDRPQGLAGQRRRRRRRGGGGAHRPQRRAGEVRHPCRRAGSGRGAGRRERQAAAGRLARPARGRDR